MRKFNRNRRNYIIIGLCAILLVMAVGYAAFASRLTINGTAETTSNWNVRITAITPNIPAGSGAYECKTSVQSKCEKDETGTSTPQVLDDGLTAKFRTGLVSPGDTITYDVKIENLGTLKAKLNKITATLDSGSSTYIDYKIKGVKEGGTVLAPKDDEDNLDETHVYVTVTYRDIAAGQGQPDVTTWGLTVKLDFSQTSDAPASGFLSPNDLKSLVVTTGNGLYADDTEPGRYIYRGAGVNNYITFNGEDAGWRIISVENDGTLKIRRERYINDRIAWDNRNNRNSSVDTFCAYASNSGCSAWAATSNLVGTPEQFTVYSPNGGQDTATATYSGTVTKDASLNTFLNEEYYKNESGNSKYLGVDKQYIVKHNFNVGGVGGTSDEDSIETNYNQEKRYVWNGYVGLISITDFMKASKNSGCTSLKQVANSRECTGSSVSTNWMYGGYNDREGEWTMSPGATSSNVWYAKAANSKSGSTSSPTDSFQYCCTNYYIVVRPVVFLTKNLKLDGSGTQNDPYVIE